MSPRRAAAPLSHTVRRHGVSALKAAVAAAVAWYLARRFVPIGPGFYAPLVAALSVHPTVARTVRDAGQRLLAVGLGLLVGYVAVQALGVHWWSLLPVTLVAVLLSNWRRLGAEGSQVTIAALLMMLLAGDPERYGGGLIVEGLIGAGVAALVNLVLVPPVHLRAAAQALTDLRLALGDLVDGMARDVGGDEWPPESPDWLERARDLREPLSAARDAVDRGSESVRLNPRARGVRAVPREQAETLDALEYVVLDVKQMARTLTAAADADTPSFMLGNEFRPRFAETLHTVAGAVNACGDREATPQAAAARSPVEEARAQVSDLQRDVHRVGLDDVAALVAEGALLADLEQLVSSLESGPLHVVGEEGQAEPPERRSESQSHGRLER